MRKAKSASLSSMVAGVSESATDMRRGPSIFGTGHAVSISGIGRNAVVFLLTSRYRLMNSSTHLASQ